MNPDESDDTIEMMERYGGGFFEAIALAYRRGDPNNRARLAREFAEEFAKYAELARLRDERDRDK